MAAYSTDSEKSHASNRDYEMREVYTPTAQRTPSLYSFTDSNTLYEHDQSYNSRSPYNSGTPYNSRPLNNRSAAYSPTPYDSRSPIPSSGYVTPNYAYDSTARLALDRKYATNPIAIVAAQKFASDFTSFSTTYPDNAYAVEITGKRDDGDHLSNWRRRLYRLSPLTTLLSVGAYYAYFTLRILFTIYAQKKYHNTFIMAWFFITSEMIVAFPAIFHQLWQLTAIRGRKRPQLRIRGDIAPTVNVLVTCCKEDPDVILDTVRAACVVDYPRDRFRVTVCDDGADPDLKAGVKAMKEMFPNLYYHARVKVKGVPHHFKAGNLIAATEFVASLEGGPAEFLAALDADMIPEHDWLSAIMAPLCVDPKMALSCPPQLFYNVPPNDPLVQSLDGFVHTMETVKDASGVAWCTGSGYAIRVAALESIGGWPTGSLAEDVCTSSMLLGRGWRTAYIHEPLQWGTVPDDLASHLKQRTRWTLGTLQTAKKLNFFLFGRLIGRMTFFQRLSGFVFAIDAFFKIFFVVSIMTFPVVLISGHTMVAYASTDQLRLQVRFCFGALILQRLNEFIMALPAGYRRHQREGTSMLWMAPYHAITVIRSFILPKWLGGKAVAFTSSGSIASLLNERNPALRAGVLKRLKVVLWDCKAYMHLLYILFVVAAVSLSTVRAFTTQHTVNDTLIYLVTHAAWPPLLWLVTLVSCLTPILYALFPPSMPDREELLDRNPKTGVAHPKEQWKAQRWNGWSWYYEMQYTLLTAFTCLVFVATFFITDNINNHIGDSVGGGGSTVAPTPVVPVNLCGQYQDVNSNNGQYVIGTNQWGQDSSGAQCLYYDPALSNEAQNTTAFQTTWSWLERPDNVHSFPNAAPSYVEFPISVSSLQAINVDITWTYGMGNTAATTTSLAALEAGAVKANVAFDCFLSSNSQKAGNPQEADFEFMVWLAQFGGTQPIGYSPTDTTISTSGGQSFTLYTGANTFGQTVHSWLPTNAIQANVMYNTFSGDINELLQYTITSGAIPKNAWLGSMQFGTETTHSVGNATFDASRIVMSVETS